MSEKAKTAIFILIAAIVGGWAYASRPVAINDAPEEEVNKPLFPEFSDPLQAQSMLITRFDPERATIRKFEVANTKNGWQIVTKGGYPANATEHMTKAAVSLVDLKVLRVIEATPGQQPDYGVVEPNANSLTAADEGVGQMISIKDSADKILANLIVGYADKENAQLRYVRVPGRNRIYLVKLDPTVFSTEFSDWIDKDLLEVNPFDVLAMRFRNYTLQLTAQGTVGFSPQMDAQVAFNEASNGWNLTEFQAPTAGDPAHLQPAQIPEGEALNTERLNAIRDALKDVTIVDVVPKPLQLADALKKDFEIQKLQQDDWGTLIATGFLPYTLPGEDTAKICGVNGEVVFETKDAVRYRLLFGNQRLGGENKDQRQQYLFVQAEFAQEMVPMPELQEVPEIKEGEGQDVEAQDKLRREIKDANGRALDVYHQRLAAAKLKILDLNDKFADWYYVVSSEDIAKIQLKRDQIAVNPNQPADQQGGRGMLLPSAGGMGGPPTKPEVMQPGAFQQPMTPADSSPEPKEPTEEKPASEEPMNSGDEEKPAEPETEESATIPKEEEKDEPTETEESANKSDESSDDSQEDSND